MNRNTRIIAALAIFVCVMVGAAYGSVPLYTLFCKATGLGGTTQRATSASGQIKNRTVTVSFDGNVDSALPWNFVPEVRKLRLKLGEVKTVKYVVHNRSTKTLV